MRLERFGLVGAIAGVVLGGIVATVGCEGAEDDVSSGDEPQAELNGGLRFHRRHRVADAGTVGGGAAGGNGATTPDGGSAGGTAADCDICTKAQQCCQVLPGQPTCTFTAETCNPLVGDARAAHINACLTFVVSVRGTWGGDPPAECR